MDTSGAITLGQCGPGSDSNDCVYCISQSSGFTEDSQSDWSVLYTSYSFRETFLSAEMNSVYSTAPADWTSGLRSYAA